ncbi:MAG: metal ABC transporter permease [Pseudomonadota bacterium]
MTGDVGVWEMMALPFAECLVLVGIHSYLGLHVLRRQVIFVDLALAQIAALGTTIAFLFQIDPLSKGAYVFSLVATVLGAALFSLTRFRREKIPQEAVIGLVYALASAVGILIVARAPRGAEHIQQILTGQLLWVKGSEVAAAAAVYTLVGAFHFIFRRKFMAISDDPERARADGINVRLWDFLFYVSFGLVITHSVRTAGVLLVFVFLVVPAILGILITSRLTLQLLIGWGVGLLVSVGGLALSYRTDMATGPTVVSLYGAVLLAVSILLWVLRSRRGRLRTVGVLVLGCAILAAVAAGTVGLGRWMGSDPYWSRMDGRTPLHPHGDHGHAGDGGVPDGEACVGDCPVHRFLHGLEPLDIEARSRQVAALEDPRLLEEILLHVEPGDAEMRLVVARRVSEVAPAAGIPALLDLLSTAEIPLIRNDAMDALVVHSKDDFGYDPWDDPETAPNREALQRWADWAAAWMGRATSLPFAGFRRSQLRVRIGDPVDAPVDAPGVVPPGVLVQYGTQLFLLPDQDAVQDFPA